MAEDYHPMELVLSHQGLSRVEMAQEVEILQNFATAISIPLANTDADKWPIRSGRVGRFCLDVFTQELLTDTRSLQQEKSPEKIAELFHGPSQVWRMSHHVMNGLDMQKKPIGEKRQAVFLLVDLVKNLKHGDPFCRDGNNIVWSPAQVQQELSTVRMNPIDPENTDDKTNSRIIHNAAGMLWAYLESSYFVAHELGVEIHGGYDLPDRTTLLDIATLHLSVSAC